MCHLLSLSILYIRLYCFSGFGLLRWKYKHRKPDLPHAGHLFQFIYRGQHHSLRLFLLLDMPTLPASPAGGILVRCLHFYAQLLFAIKYGYYACITVNAPPTQIRR